jgi:hypothetical protein
MTQTFRMTLTADSDGEPRSHTVHGTVPAVVVPATHFSDPSGGAARRIAVVVTSPTSMTILSLSPDEGFAIGGESCGGADVDRTASIDVGGWRMALHLSDGPSLVRATFALGTQLRFPAPTPQDGRVLITGELPMQAFRSIEGSAVAGPSGSHALPALMQRRGETGQLIIRGRQQVARVTVTDDDLDVGVLVGRSRRCVLGREFDEQEGLSRVHALVRTHVDGQLYVHDVASRYGLRDVRRIHLAVQSARIDDGVGVIVCGAGQLTWV